MANKDGCDTCYWNDKATWDGYIKCYKDKEWRKRKRCRTVPHR